ncbi:MAG: methyl-accepting chemotaxis protein [Neptuniibacter sp.]
MENSLNKQIADSEQTLSVVLKEPMFSYDQGLINNIVESFVVYKYIQNIQVYDHRGKWIGGSNIDDQSETSMVLEEKQIDVFWEGENKIGYLKVNYRLDANDGLLYATQVMFLLIAAVLLIALQATNWLVLTRYVVKPIEIVASAMSDIAQGGGDLTRRLNITSNDEVGMLSKGFDAFITNLHQLIQRIVDTADELSVCSGEIKVNGDGNAASARLQKREVGQVTEAVKEMSSVTGEVARNANSTAASTQTCNDLAIQGSKIVKKTVAEIHDLDAEISDTSVKVLALKDKSDHINTVMEVIKDIAAQTNLLALNAAIEAARAGEQGRGFSVVADEVRALALRTHQSTEEIENIIQALQLSTDEVDRSMTGAQATLKQTISESHQAIVALDDIIGGMDQINDMNAQIAAATEEQYTTTESISDKFDSINEIIDSINLNADKVVDLGNQLDDLRECIRGDLSNFKL